MTMMSNLYFSFELILPSIRNKSLAFTAITGSLTQEAPESNVQNARLIPYFYSQTHFVLSGRKQTGKSTF